VGQEGYAQEEPRRELVSAG
jgi:hypothetical protein